MVHVSLALFVPTLVGLFQLLGGLGILFVYLSSSDTQNTEMVRLLAAEKKIGMRDAANSLIKTLRDATLAVEYFTPSIQDCLPSAPPLSNRSGETLLRTLGALPDASATAEGWLTIGTMQRDNATGAKWTWQIAAGFGCPSYIYAYSDAAIWPQFHGYCASLSSGESGYRLDTGRLAYNGTDWGFKDNEKALLNGTFDEVLMSVTPLLGVLTCTYQRAVRCRTGKPFAIAFADRALPDLDAALAALRVSAEGVSFIVERQTGLLVAASVANQTSTAKPGINEWTKKPELVPERVAAVNAPDATIAAAAAVVVAAAPDYSIPVDFSAPLLVTAERFAPMRGVDWLLVVAIPSDLIVGGVREVKTKSIVVFVVVVALSVLLAGAITFLCVSLPLRDLAARLAGRRSKGRGAWFSEISEVNTAANPTTPLLPAGQSGEMASARRAD